MTYSNPFANPVDLSPLEGAGEVSPPEGTIAVPLSKYSRGAYTDEIAIQLARIAARQSSTITDKDRVNAGL